MHKRDYFVEALKRDLYVPRTWLIRVFGIPAQNFESQEPYAPNFVDGQWFIHDDEGTRHNLEGAVAGKPLYEVKEGMTLEAGDMKNVDKATKTAYSDAIINQLLFVWPFEKPLPYIATGINKKILTPIIGVALDTGWISVEEYTGKFTQAAHGRLTAFTQIAVTAATPKSILPSKEALAVKNKMIKENPHRLSDPAFLAELDTAVSAADRESLKDDESAKFFLKAKAYDVVRKKTYHVQGGIAKLDDPTKMDFIDRSLDEGLRPEDMAATVNALRSGSYGRAKDTALGGEAAKFANRVFQNTKIDGDDCGTKIGEPTLIDNKDVKRLVGRYLVGSDTPLTKEALQKLVGKQVNVRSPNACKEPNRNYCKKCMGDSISKAGIVSIGPQMGAVGNVFMSVALAAFHGSSLKTKKAKMKDICVDLNHKG